ncbi:MAG: archaeosortase/exosortase family protein [Actinobacteria bacterium]|nr:archaeosortase/exosortase family protein [Actinomycetota bacterium]
MSTVVLAGEGRAARRAARRPRLVLLLVAGAASLALSAVVLRESVALRTFEAWLSGRIVSPLTGIPAGAVPRAPIVWFANGPHRYLGMFVSSECTVDPLIVPFTMGTTWVAWRQSRVVRPLAALAVATCLLLGMNQFRLLIIILLTQRWGYRSGFYWGHTFTGSLITVFGVAFTFFVYALIGTRRKRSRPRRRRGSHVIRPTVPPAS